MLEVSASISSRMISIGDAKDMRREDHDRLKSLSGIGRRRRLDSMKRFWFIDVAFVPGAF